MQSPIPGFPDLNLPTSPEMWESPDVKVAVWIILLIILAALGIFFFLTRKKKRGKKR